MPLSEHEQRLLEQMEQAMYAEDPKFASAMRGRSSRARQRRRFLVGGVGLILALVLVVFGVAKSQVPLAVVGFIIGLASLAFGVSPERKGGPVGVVTPEGGTPQRRKSKARSGAKESFLTRLEHRWDRRRDER